MASRCQLFPFLVLYPPFSLLLSSDTHPKTRHQFLREVVDHECDCEKDKTHHDEGAVMRAPADHLAHFLRDDSGHCVDGLKNGAQSLGEIRNRDPIPGAKENHRRLASHPAEPKQDCRNNSRERCRHQHARDRLQPIRAQRVGSFFESARNVAERVFR